MNIQPDNSGRRRGRVNAMKQLKLAKNGYIIMSVLFMILGICLIIWPDCSMAVFCTAVGIMFIVYGAIKIIGYFSRDFYCLAFQFDLAFGVLLAAVGVVIMILADALFKIQTSIDAKKFGLSLWWRILLMAILAGVLGLLLLVRPFEAAEVMMILVGVSLLFEGILNLCVAIYTVKIIKNQKQDIIDMDEY